MGSCSSRSHEASSAIQSPQRSGSLHSEEEARNSGYTGIRTKGTSGTSTSSGCQGSPSAQPELPGMIYSYDASSASCQEHDSDVQACLGKSAQPSTSAPHPAGFQGKGECKTEFHENTEHDNMRLRSASVAVTDEYSSFQGTNYTDASSQTAMLSIVPSGDSTGDDLEYDIVKIVGCQDPGLGEACSSKDHDYQRVGIAEQMSSLSSSIFRGRRTTTLLSRMQAHGSILTPASLKYPAYLKSVSSLAIP